MKFTGSAADPRSTSGAGSRQDWEQEDRRKEDREPADSEILLMPDESRALLVWGVMVDVSAGGFRARHACSSLEAGALVRFRHSTATGVARVVWNRSADGTWESGFLVVEAAPHTKPGARR